MVSDWFELYIYVFVSLAQVSVVYVVKKDAPFKGPGQLMGVACKRTHAHATYQ